MAHAVITGGEGSNPLADPGWPEGAAVIFNHPSRVAWWEGPPFGGGQWHAECRGDAETLTRILKAFADLQVKTKRVIVRDGIGRSFWLNPNREPARQTAAQIDWRFMVWQPQNWERLRRLPSDLQPADARDADSGPPAEIMVYTGGHVRWTDVKVPAGLELIDQRLETHGFNVSDGIVLEGHVVDLETGKPLAARVQLQRVEPQSTGGYRYPLAAEVATDAAGHWVLKNAPAGWHRVVIEADGYAPRVVGYMQFDEQPGWHPYDGGLLRAAGVSGYVTDDANQPLADAEVRLGNVGTDTQGRYESPHDYSTRTDAQGHFRFDAVPVGNATVRPHKKGYCWPGLGQEITIPTDSLKLQMTQSAQVRVTVDFSGLERPAGYIVQMEPEGGSQVGKWSGSGNIDVENQIAFADVPPGRYVIRGQPNPGSENQRSKSVTIDLQGGAAIEISLPAK
ncbi:MAG: carboxypeptidase regulatory-like domain-containing protein [Pirellulaceae bacterium]